MNQHLVKQEYSNNVLCKMSTISKGNTEERKIPVNTNLGQLIIEITLL